VTGKILSPIVLSSHRQEGVYATTASSIFVNTASVRGPMCAIVLPAPTPLPPLKYLGRKRPQQVGLERHRPSYFVKLLRQILDANHCDSIKWTNAGSCFEILNQERLAAEVLPCYFAHNNFASFQRQLNYFGFRRCQRGGRRPMVYMHECFHRDHPKLMHLISRSTNKKCSSLVAQINNFRVIKDPQVKDLGGQDDSSQAKKKTKSGV